MMSRLRSLIKQQRSTLKYETGECYKLKKVEYRMSDPSKPLLLTQKVLDSLAPWKEGNDYAFWRVNVLANNLTNTRYFNYTLVDTIQARPIQPPLGVTWHW